MYFLTNNNNNNNSPSHASAKQSVDLTVVGEKYAESFVLGRQLEAGQIAKSGNGVSVVFHKVQVHQIFQRQSPLLHRLVQNYNVQFQVGSQIVAQTLTPSFDK